MATSGVVVDKESCNKNVTDLGLNEWLVVQCKALHMTTPTPIQLHCVPEILKGGVIFSDRCAAPMTCGDGMCVTNNQRFEF